MASEHAIDIDPDNTGPPHWKERCIYKVPESIRGVNPEAYNPKLVSIGPIHHGKPELKQMEQEKQRYSELFWRRSVSISLPDAWEARNKDYLAINEKNIRLCYSEEYPELSSDKFVDMILLDTVFIIELFLKKLETDKQQQDDYLFDKLWICKGIELDLLLIENQVPIFTLKYLYECYAPKKREKYPTFFELAGKYFESCYPQKSSEEIDRRSPKHFTDLIRLFYILRDPTSSNNDDSFPVLPKTASELEKAGVSFGALDGKCSLDIKFENSWLNWILCLGCFPCSDCVKARLQLRQLNVDGTTERVLRNIIALEQCHYPCHTHVCSYISVLDNLINGKEDVELLVDEGVIVHRLGNNEEMASMINGLCKHVVIKCPCYEKTIKDLNEHWASCWKTFMGVIK